MKKKCWRVFGMFFDEKRLIVVCIAMYIEQKGKEIWHKDYRATWGLSWNYLPSYIANKACSKMHVVNEKKMKKCEKESLNFLIVVNRSRNDPNQRAKGNLVYDPSSKMIG